MFIKIEGFDLYFLTRNINEIIVHVREDPFFKFSVFSASNYFCIKILARKSSDLSTESEVSLIQSIDWIVIYVRETFFFTFQIYFHLLRKKFNVPMSPSFKINIKFFFKKK